MKLYNKNYTRREIEARVGRIDTLGGIRKYQMSEGPERGVEFIEVRTGGGLRYLVNTTRALDIGLTEFCGTPLSWHSVVGEKHPSYFEQEGLGWLRSASGGMLMTCGLTQVGSPANDQGESLGIHGRVHHTPASQVCASGEWVEDDYTLSIKGITEESRLFGEKIRLTREIQSRLGSNRIEVTDMVENFGFEETPHMILYHLNFGFPLMDKNAVFNFPSKSVTSRDKWSSPNGYQHYDAPSVGIKEDVYYHELDPNQLKEDWASVQIINPDFPTGNSQSRKAMTVEISWNTKNLPRLHQWKMTGSGTYALGIEPANCDVKGRVWERENGNLQVLQPGEKRVYKLIFDFYQT